jgi:hypothetical protein
MIKFGISENYVPDWGVVQAIREIYQNFIDYGTFDVSITQITDGHSCVRISNDYNPDSWEFLKIGFSNKKDGSIGKHGEGLKLAGLIFNRNKKGFRIDSPIGRAEPIYYEDDNIGVCYGLGISDIKTDKFEIYFEADDSDIEVFKEGYLKDEDIIHSTYYGNIVNKKKGNIYVGGLYVCYLKDFKYAMDFNPDLVNLGRDRSVPSTWDLEYYSNKIVNECSGKLDFKPEDVYNREIKCGDIPCKLSSQFKPVKGKSGEINMKSGQTVVTDREIVRKISKNPVVAKKIEKLRYTAIFNTRKAPSTMLTDVKKELNLSTHQKIRFDSIIKVSRGWRWK